MSELLNLDEEDMENLAAALGVTTLEQKFELLLNDFRSLVAYTNQLHAALEQSIGEPVASADIKVSGGMGQRLAIQRNVTHMPSLAIRNTIRQPRTVAVSESVQPRVLPTVQSTPR